MSNADSCRSDLTNVEAGRSLRNTVRDNQEPASAPSSNAAPPAPKSGLKWLVRGTIAVLVGVGIVLAAWSGGGGATSATAAATPATAPEVAVPRDVQSILDGDAPSIDAARPADSGDDVGSTNGAQGDTAKFTPQVTVGDAAALALPEVAATPLETTADPTQQPTASPSALPTNEPTDSPTPRPSRSLTGAPTKQPTLGPTSSPSGSPTDQPTNEPTEAPTPPPSPEPILSPSASPTNEPTDSPTSRLSESPTDTPTKDPTEEPTKEPTKEPTLSPTALPTSSPSEGPTNTPTRRPTNVPTEDPTTSPTTLAPTEYEPFFFGDEFYTRKDLGIDVSVGLSVRVIAREGKRVKYANGGRSKPDYHTMTDAAGIIPMDPDNPLEGGYAYVVNSEEGDGDGGVYGIYFDKDGNVLKYKDLLTGTTDNCGGGLTPWNTWVSCEEYSDGQCWEVDPVNEWARVTKLGGRGGGRYESVACDNSDPNRPVFFTTEDDEEGALRRFVARGKGKGALQRSGDETFLLIKGDGKYAWTTNLEKARKSAEKHYRNAEGIQYYEGKVYFMPKKDYVMIILDLEDMTYEKVRTGRKFYGEGSFGDQPDQNLFGPTRKYLYFTEDGGESPGVYARYGKDETFFTLFQAIKGGVYDGDETVGIALSPDHRRFYAGIQDPGTIFEFTRDDGLPFE